MNCNTCHATGLTTRIGDQCSSCDAKDYADHFTCSECGNAERAARWGGAFGASLRERKLCFTCGFWHDYIEDRDDPCSVRVDGTHYFIGPETPHVISRGYGGKKFTICFNNGRVTHTTNLWHQGEIPERFRDRLPDNATFAKKGPTT